MNFFETPLEKYAREHPGCTLEEYCEFLREEKLRINEQLKKEEEEKIQAYKDLIGKCIKINFNGNSVAYFKVNTDPTKSTSIIADSYEIYIDRNSRISMVFEHNRYINVSWLPIKGGIKYVDATIISEERFNEIVDYFNEVIPKLKELH